MDNGNQGVLYAYRTLIRSSVLASGQPSAASLLRRAAHRTVPPAAEYVPSGIRLITVSKDYGSY